jgi:hypothetical protein
MRILGTWVNEGKKKAGAGYYAPALQKGRWPMGMATHPMNAAKDHS